MKRREILKAAMAGSAMLAMPFTTGISSARDVKPACRELLLLEITHHNSRLLHAWAFSCGSPVDSKVTTDDIWMFAEQLHMQRGGEAHLLVEEEINDCNPDKYGKTQSRILFLESRRDDSGQFTYFRLSRRIAGRRFLHSDAIRHALRMTRGSRVSSETYYAGHKEMMASYNEPSRQGEQSGRSFVEPFPFRTV